MAVREKIAFAATGLAKSSRPGRMLNSVVAHMARIGVLVQLFMCPKYPRSGRPGHTNQNDDPEGRVWTRRQRRTVITTECIHCPRARLQSRLADEKGRETDKGLPEPKPS